MSDVALLRSLRWRELVARFFDGPDLAASADGIESIEIDQVPGTEGEVVEGELLVSWIGAQLGWQASSPP